MDDRVDSDPISSLLREKAPWLSSNGCYATNYFSVAAPPAQGWKIHLSATHLAAPQVLDIALPILLERGLSFKVVNSTPALLAMNNGVFGRAQIGKFITIYPPDDVEAVDVALAIDDRTKGLPGPSVPTDRPLRPGSLVHYRFGAFVESERRDTSVYGGDLLDDHGRLCRDAREVCYTQPTWITVDPFEEAGVYVAATPRRPPLAGRFLIFEVLSTSSCGGTYLAVDLAQTPVQQCVIKEFWAHAGGDEAGRFAPDWGRTEGQLLADHASNPHFLRCYDTFDLDGNFYLAVEYVPGMSLAAEIERRQNIAEWFDYPEIADIALRSATILAAIHADGVIYRDFKPSNIILQPDHNCRLIDFGSAFDSVRRTPLCGWGTAGFSSAEQWNGDPPAPADDIFSWGTVLRFLLDGVENHAARFAANGGPETDRFTHLRAELERLAECTTQGGSRTAVSTEEVVERLRALEIRVDRHPQLRSSAHVMAVGECALSPDKALTVAQNIGERLLDAAIERDGGLCWPTNPKSEPTLAISSPDIYHGAAGIGLFLAELGVRSNDSRYTDAAVQAARWLAGPAWRNGRALPGLYAGESGVGLFYLRLGEALGETAWQTAAELRARRLRDCPMPSVDLVDGMSGYLLFLSQLARLTGKDSHLRHAQAAATSLITYVKQFPRSSTSWPTRDNSQLGLSHGLAGVALAVADYAHTADDTEAKRTADHAGSLLRAQALENPSGGWRWPESQQSQRIRVQGQCHGAIGIGQLFVRLRPTSGGRDYEYEIQRCVQTAASGIAARTNPGICHGLAGDAVFLLEAAAALKNPSLIDQVSITTSLLMEPSRFPELGMDGGLPKSFDLLNGIAGVGWLFLQLACPRDRADPVLP